VFGDRHLARMEEIMPAVCADFETEQVEFNGENNHARLLVNIPHKAAPAKLVNSLNGVPSRRMPEEFPELARHYYRANKLWSGSYFAGSLVGAPLSGVRQYIEQQNRPIQVAAPAVPTSVVIMASTRRRPRRIDPPPDGLLVMVKGIAPPGWMGSGRTGTGVDDRGHLDLWAVTPGGRWPRRARRSN
jgi:putative transposase